MQVSTAVALAAGIAGAFTMGAAANPPLAESQNGAPVRYQFQYPAVLRDADFPNPAARVQVAGRSVWLLFDTGAGVHMLAAWFVKAAGLPTAELEGMLGLDSTGRPLTFRAVRGVSLTFSDGGELSLPEAAVVEFPPFFEDAEVAGVVSPQLLSPAGSAAVLDLRIPELRIEEFDAAVRRLGAVEVPCGAGATVCSEAAPLRNRLFTLQASVGGEQASMLLDSGAAHSKLSSTSRAAQKLTAPLEDGTSTGLSGVVDRIKIARQLPVRLGMHAATADVRIGSGKSSCGGDGLLGLDVIRGCAFVLAEERIAFACGARHGREVER